MTAEQIINYIATSEKKTPVKLTVKENAPIDYKSAKVFGAGDKIVYGDWRELREIIEDNADKIDDIVIENSCRNSAIPMLDIKDINARIEPGAVIREQVSIGDNAVIMMGAIINIGAVIGSGTMIDMGAVLGGRATVGSNCHVGAGAVLAGVIEPASAKPVILEDNVLVGANAVVIEGVHVGKNAVIAAGCVVIEDVIVPDKCGLANRLHNASLPSFAIHHQPLPSSAGVGMAGDERQQVTPRLDLDFVHLMGLDDLNVNHRVGERFPQIGNRYGIAHLQAVYVPKIIRAMPPSMPGNDAVGICAANGRRSVSQHGGPCGKVRIRRAQVDRHDQLQRGYLQYTYDLVLHAVVSQQYSRLLTGQSVGQSRLPLRINALVISLQVCQQLGV